MDAEKSSISEDGKEKDLDLHYSYNDALSMAGLGKFHYFLLLTCGICLMSVIVETLNVGFVIPLIDYECDLKLTLSEKGFLSSSAFVGIVISSYLWGFLADLVGRHRIMLMCSTSSFLFSFLSSFSSHTWMLITTRFFVGFFISGLAANTYAYLGEFHSDTSRARHLNFCGVFMAFALTFCPGLGWCILKFQEATEFSFYIPIVGINYSIWRIFLLICSSLTLYIAIFLLYLPESPKFLLYQDRHDEALKILQNIYKANTGSTYFSIMKISIDEQLVNRIQLGEENLVQLLWSQTSPLFKSPLFKHTWKLSFIMFSLFAASSGFYMFVPEILNKMMLSGHGGMSVCNVLDSVIGSKNSTNSSASCTSSIAVNDTIYSITFFMGIFFSAVYFMNGLIINRVGKRNLLGLWFFICGLSSILIPFNDNFYVILLLLLLFLTSGCCGSIASAIIVDIYPTHIRAISLCIILTLGRIGAILGSLFVSFMIVTSCELMFILFGLLLILSVLVSCIIPD